MIYYMQYAYENNDVFDKKKTTRAKWCAIPLVRSVIVRLA